MNIFYVDENPVIAAQMLVNKHIVKMPTETAQILANCYSTAMLANAPKTQKGAVRKYSYPNHPCTIWARTSIDNFTWTLTHGIALTKEYTHRYGKIHFCTSFFDWCLANRPDRMLTNQTKFTQPACAVKDYPILSTVIETYRNYYNQDKRNLFAWKNREKPDWIL